ncbi:class I SAM-dependent methyltransferase [Neisseria chenwenguii]|uniref:Methyltransferase n=1 Tax=Neisseria chenwenguii TaxID=1853278 RepID=A0A220S298_9NEIS|nr:class I SAM-dependent methyltransferase [Neisseria chenwenguii]ASK27609.1 methyltransferase [Neisseria chenwenguii]ROV55504.1 class I SAM-dependent methyltransferase [Neisseria chenwenguii]
MDLKESDILGSDISRHWYYRAKARAVTELLKGQDFSRILDVGAGSAFFTRYLLENTVAQSACCVDISYGADRNGTYADKPVSFRRNIETADADLVLMMDVLEHVEDDLSLLQEYIGKVKNEGGVKFLISVPAFQFLWSGHDVFLEHCRRYNLQELENVVTKAGLRIIKSHYGFGTVFPIAAVTRMAGRLKPQRVESQLKIHHPAVNGFLSALCRLDLPVQHLNRLAGLTVFCLAKKD